MANDDVTAVRVPEMELRLVPEGFGPRRWFLFFCYPHGTDKGAGVQRAGLAAPMRMFVMIVGVKPNKTLLQVYITITSLAWLMVPVHHCLASITR